VIELKIKPIEIDHYILTGQINDFSLINILKEKIKEKVKTSNFKL
jgi:hypothetical protein